jgi:hypothetical protein
VNSFQDQKLWVRKNASEHSSSAKVVEISVTMLDQRVHKKRPLLLLKCQMLLSRHLQFNLLLLRLLLRFKPFLFSPLWFQLLKYKLLPFKEMTLYLPGLCLPRFRILQESSLDGALGVGCTAAMVALTVQERSKI